MDTKIKNEWTGLQMLTGCDSQKKEKILVIDVGPAHLKIDKDLLDLDKPLSSQEVVCLNPFFGDFLYVYA